MDQCYSMLVKWLGVLLGVVLAEIIAALITGRYDVSIMIVRTGIAIVLVVALVTVLLLVAIRGHKNEL